MPDLASLASHSRNEILPLSPDYKCEHFCLQLGSCTFRPSELL